MPELSILYFRKHCFGYLLESPHLGDSNKYPKHMFCEKIRIKMPFLISLGFFIPANSTLRKHAYSNILKISPPKTENFQIKNSDIFHISAQSRNKKNNVYLCKPQFYYIKVGFRGVKII